MRISKRALLVHKVSRKDAYIHGVKVESDGSTVATDGHRLMKYTPTWMPDETVRVQDEGLEPFVLPGDVAKDACSMMKGKSPVDAELDVPATNQNGTARLNVAGALLLPEKDERDFPKYENIVPGDSEISATVGLNVAYGAELFATLKQQGFETVALSLLEPKDVGSRHPVKTADRPIIIKAQDADGKCLVVWMPCHLG